ncbi:hypothetical protein ABPG72_001705 [Tetrahymena utriculariae]
MKEKSIFKKTTASFNQNQSSPNKFSVQFNTDSQSTTQNYNTSQQATPKLHLKFSEIQNKDQIIINQQISENISEQEEDYQNFCQTKYLFKQEDSSLKKDTLQSHKTQQPQ